jgi:chaperonin cofactor prefoldin
MVTTLQNDTERGTEKFRAMDDALRKKVWRGRHDGVERTVILKQDLDETLTRLMRAENLDRSTVVNRCIENAAFSRKQEWDKLEAKRSSLQKREERLRARENRVREREEADRESRMAEEGRACANNALDLLIRGLSKAPDDAAVELQFDADGSISDIEFREGNSRTRVWSEDAKKELGKALERYMSGEACSTQEDGARDQSRR